MCALCTFIVPIVHQVHFNCKSEFLIFFFYFDVSHAWGFAEIEKVNLYYLYEVRRYTSWLVNNWDGALFIFKSDLIILESPTSSLHFFFTNCSESVVDKYSMENTMAWPNYQHWLNPFYLQWLFLGRNFLQKGKARFEL